MLSEFGKITSPWCSFCKLHGETVMHLFYDFYYGINWNLYYQKVLFFQ